MPLKTAKKHTIKRATPTPTLGVLSRQLAQLRSRVEDLEDLRELNEAIARNGQKPGISWETAKADLGI